MKGLPGEVRGKVFPSTTPDCVRGVWGSAGWSCDWGGVR